MNRSEHGLGASLLSLGIHRLFGRPSIFRIGRNAWRTARAARVAFCIDADAFFRAFAEAAEQAESQLIIVGWDTDSRTELPDGRGALGDFLARLVEKKPSLRVYVLSWDFAFIYLLERESLQAVRFSQLGHERFRFVFDQEHPFWASHHQKVVVIDDEIAFSGGLDLTARRWDTPEHRGVDDRRIDPWGGTYGPFHDVQICVAGPVAGVLGELVRDRWSQATGETLTLPVKSEKRTSKPIWPESCGVAMNDVEVAVSRTTPIGYGRVDDLKPEERQKPVKEVERLFLDMIRSARKHIYIENQYFTSPVIARAIARRLMEDSGPEIVMVLPRDQTGWIEESTMGLLRLNVLRIVEARDRKGKFRCFYPIVPDLGEGYVKVHSKVMIIDDEIVRIGSANLNRRSMGLDTECDLTIEACGRPEVRHAIANLRSSLLCEHLGADPAQFQAKLVECGSLIETLESFRGGTRDFVQLRGGEAEWVEKMAPPREWIDPSGPRGIRRWITKRISQNRHSLGAGLIFTVLLGLFFLREYESSWAGGERVSVGELFAWVKDLWGSFSSIDGHKIAEMIGSIRSGGAVRPLVLLGFVVGSFLFVPITAMILGVALTFSPPEALALAIGGSALAALATYGLGRYWAWSKSRYLTRPWIQNLSQRIKRGGVVAMTLIRMTPIAPFTAVSIVAGGLRIPVVAYMLGSVFGLLPGIIAITFLSGEAMSRARSADWRGTALVLLLAFTLFVGIPFFMKRRRHA